MWGMRMERGGAWRVRARLLRMSAEADLGEGRKPDDAEWVAKFAYRRSALQYLSVRV